jgi:hypothetical protein
MSEANQPVGIWSRTFNRWLRKGADHGDAAYRADQAEERVNRDRLAGKTAKQWAEAWLAHNGWSAGDDLGETEPAFAWLFQQVKGQRDG